MRGKRTLFSSHLNRKGILNVCVMQSRYQAMYQHWVPAKMSGLLRGHWTMKFFSFCWGSVAGLQLGSCLEGTWKLSPSFPPSLPHTSVLLSLHIKRKMGKKLEPVFYSLRFSTFKTVWAAEGLKSVIATEDTCSAWFMLSTLINQSSHSYEEMFFKNLILNLIWVWNEGMDFLSRPSWNLPKRLMCKCTECSGNSWMETFYFQIITGVTVAKKMINGIVAKVR